MKILFCSLDSPGFLFPAMDLALGLAARSHSIAFVTNRECDKWLRPHGLTRIPRSDQDGSSFQNSVWGQPWAVAIQVKHLEYAIKKFEPDLLVGQQLTLGALIAAERNHIPVALLGFCTYLWPSSVVQTNAQVAESKEWRFRDILERFNGIRALFRLPACDGDVETTRLLGDLFMVRSIPELEPDFDQLPSRVHLIGPCMWDPTDDDPDLECWLKNPNHLAHPLVYVQQGRFFDHPHFWPKVIQALASQAVRVVASTGAMDCEIGEVPPNFFVRPHVPQGQVLRDASAMIASGNTTAVLGALLAGIPSILIPAGGEQPDVAQCCQNAGVARVLSPTDLTSESLLAEFEVLLHDEKLRETARHLGTRFAESNTVQHGCDLLETLGATRSPVLRNQHCTAEA